MKFSHQIATSDVTTPLLPSAKGTLGDNLSIIAEFGYEAVELSVRNPAELDVAEIEKEIKSRKLEVSIIHGAAMGFQDGVRLCNSKEEIRKEALKRHKDALDLATHFGAPGMVLGSSRGKLLEGEGREESKRWMYDGIREVTDYAAEKGLKIFFEPLNHFNANFCINTAESLLFFKEFNHEGMALMLDTYHMNIDEPSFGGPIFDSRDYLGHMHLADNNRLYPGGGHVPFGEVIRALKAIDYKGYLSLQIISVPDVRTAAQKAIQHLQTFL
jgi:sugar phosphate isomerase/epimerase